MNLPHDAITHDEITDDEFTAAMKLPHNEIYLMMKLPTMNLPHD